MQNEIEWVKKEINVLQDKQKNKEKQKKSESISKWVNARQKNTSKKKTKQTKAGFFSNQKNTKYSEEYIAK